MKKQLGFVADRPLVVVTGGGLGAKRINDAIAKTVDTITTKNSLLLISGVGQYDQLRKKLGADTEHFQLKSFISSGMSDIVGAADVVVARSGATSIMELAAVSAPTILVPNARLTGGHQVKNTKVYQDAKAVLVANEDEFERTPGVLADAICALAADASMQQILRTSIHEFSKLDAAHDMADIILKAARK